MKWNEHIDEGVLTVGSQDLFYVQKFENNDGYNYSLVKTKIGIRLSNDDRDVLLGSSVLKTNNNSTIFTLSKNGAWHRILTLQASENCKFLSSEATKGYICPHCHTKLLRDIFSTKEHISRMHFGPVLCQRCKTPKRDMKYLKEHQKNCFYVCGVIGCSLLHKDELSAVNHKKRYMKSLL